jgi:UDP-N-acetylglucosamine 1-carboxyvinyltransferase
MDRFIIQGGVPLKGTITASGNKNAALKLFPACLLTEEPVTLHNVPDIDDVNSMIEIISRLGVEVERVKPNSWRVQAKTITSHVVDRELATRIRASIVLAGPLLARLGQI